ncbi:hypothetical protein ACHAW5_003826, partial [Stephanodiscus triporus]
SLVPSYPRYQDRQNRIAKSIDSWRKVRGQRQNNDNPEEGISVVTSSSSSRTRDFVGFLAPHRRILAMIVLVIAVVVVLAVAISSIQRRNAEPFSNDESGVPTMKTSTTTDDSSEYSLNNNSPTADTSSEFSNNSPAAPIPSLPINPTSSSSTSPPIEGDAHGISPILNGSSKAPSSAGLQACICDMEHNCTEPFVVHSSMILCLSSNGPLRKLERIKSLNISHEASGTIFQAIIPTESLSISDSFIVDGIDVAISPWASVETNNDQTQVTVLIKPGGLTIWFDLFAGSMIDIHGRVQIGGEGGGEKNLDGDPSPSTQQFFEDFHISAILAKQQSQSSDLAPSVGSVYPCVCNAANICSSDGDFIASKRSREVRICLFLQQMNDDSAEIELTYMKLQQEGDGIVFEAVTEGGAVSSFATIDADDKNKALSIVVEILPGFFVEPTTIKFYGVAKVTGVERRHYEAIWELSIAVEGSEVTSAVSPSLAASESSFTIEACHCDDKNNCIEDALIKTGDADPELRICIAVDISAGNDLSEIKLNSLTITQQETGMVLTLKDEEYATAGAKYDEVVEDGKIIITVPELGLFFLSIQPPAIIVEGSVGGVLFLLVIPLQSSETGIGISSGDSDGSISSEFPLIQGPGIRACVCKPELIGTKTNKPCVEKSFSVEQRDLYVCILTHPQGVELVTITLLAIELIHQDGTSVFRYHVSPSSSDVDPATIVTYKNDLSRATIITAIDEVFFEDLKFGVATVTFLGFALINSGSGTASSETSFYVDLNLVALSSSVPLSALPSPIIPKHMEVWACQCNLNDRSCSSDVLTNFKNEVSLCLFSTRELAGVDLYRISWGSTKYVFIETGTAAVDDRSSLATSLEGMQGSIVVKLPASFFQGMEDGAGVDYIEGRAVGIAVIKSVAGGKSEVGFFTDLYFRFQAQSDAPVLPSPQSFSPSSSASPTSLKEEGIEACQCNERLSCIDKPVSPISREIALCLLSQPVMFILSEGSIIVVLTQQGIPNRPIINMDEPIYGTSTSFMKSGLRRRRITTLVPEQFFLNPSQNLIVMGMGTILLTGSTRSRDVEFSVTLTLLPHPSDAPSELPSTSTEPTVKSPPTRPPQNIIPTYDNTLRLPYCACNIRNECFPSRVVLTRTNNVIRICFRASPPTAKVNVSTVRVSGKGDIPFRVCSGQMVGQPAVGASANCSPLDGNQGFVTVTLSDEFFDISAANELRDGGLANVYELRIVGVADVKVPQDGRHADEGFYVYYDVQPSSPTSVTTGQGSITPTESPMTLQTSSLTASPKASPTDSPSSVPKASPTNIPTKIPLEIPTSLPTTSPTTILTSVPNKSTTAIPTREPTASLTAISDRAPTQSPTAIPNSTPMTLPTKNPTSVPASTPTKIPTEAPTLFPNADPSRKPTAFPTRNPTKNPIREPTEPPTKIPTEAPTLFPNADPSRKPTAFPTRNPTKNPIREPTASPTKIPTKAPTNPPTAIPSHTPTAFPTRNPTKNPTKEPTASPTKIPTKAPTNPPTAIPSHTPTAFPTRNPTKNPTKEPTASPSRIPTVAPEQSPTTSPSSTPTAFPTSNPTALPTRTPMATPTVIPAEAPTESPTASPSKTPTLFPTSNPTTLSTKTPMASPTVIPQNSLYTISSTDGANGKVHNCKSPSVTTP